MAQPDSAALPMSHDQLTSALEKQSGDESQKPKLDHPVSAPQIAPVSPLADQHALMPYEMAEIQESSQPSDKAK